MKHVQLLPGVLCKLIILGPPAHRGNDLRKDLRVRSQSLGWAGVSACWSCGELEEGVGGRISSWPQPDLNPTHPTASQIQRSSPDLKEDNLTRSILLTPDSFVRAMWQTQDPLKTTTHFSCAELGWGDILGGGRPVAVGGATRLLFHKEHILLSDPGQV